MFEWFKRRTSPHLAALSQASILGDTPEGDYSRAWTRASRTAEPNLTAGTVVFEEGRG